MKKIMRKGFTLVELLVVLTVIGILSSVATISGREASNIAQANKVVENFQIIGAAMNLYYSGNMDACDGITKGGTEDNPTYTEDVTAEKIKDALEAYLKSTAYITAETSAQESKFNISVAKDASNTHTSWWLTYKVPSSNVKLAQILANRAKQEGFMSEDDTHTKNYEATNASGTLSKTEVWYQVR